MNIARALGDKFLKEQEESFSADPYVSEVLRIPRDSRALALIARFVQSVGNGSCFLVDCVRGWTSQLSRMWQLWECSDGLWDVLSPKRALQLAVEVRCYVA